MMSEAAAPVVPFLLLGETRRAAIQERLSACCAAWWSGWVCTGDAIHVEIEETHHVAQDTRRQSRIARGAVFARNAAGDYLLSVDSAPDLMLALPGGAAPCSSPARGDLVQELRMQMLRSLCDALLARAGVTDASVDVLGAAQKGAPEAWMSRSMTVEVTFGAARAAVGLVLTPVMVELLAPRGMATVALDKLSSRRKAIFEEHVRVEAFLGDAEVSLLDLAKLAQGDVIVLDHALGQTGQLLTSEGKSIAKILLGRTGSNRAVSVTG
jgi:hypothetical protein